MRRLLVPALLVAAAFAATPAVADPCDPEEGCHPYDCIAWEPLNQAPYSIEQALAGDPVGGVQALLPPPCPPY
jgi:hypothetical protein